MLRQAGTGLLEAAGAVMPRAAQAMSYSSKAFTCTLFPGDGIGPEIAAATAEVFSAAKIPVTWDEQHIGKTPDPRTNSMVTRENLDSVLVSDSEVLD